MHKNIVWRLLRRNISAGQLTGYAVANLVGLAIVLTAIQFYRSVTSVWDSEDSFISRDYIIISKKINSGMTSIFGGKTSTEFSDDEIADIKQQPWARRTGQFTACDFNVSASLDMGGKGISTALFLESIPTDFFDVLPKQWSFTPDSGSPVPIIISKDYLTLYNFGFAASRGLPQVSESMVSMLPLRLSISGAGKQQWIDARIVGFSSRLNTIAVPQEFMEWANSRFGENGPSAPSRIIIETSKPGDPAIDSYLDAHGYESAGDKVNSGRAAYFLSVATATVISVGTVISLLALFILLLSIWLLLHKNRTKLYNLMMLGYSPNAVARYYYIMIGAINAAVFIGAIVLTIIANHLWSTPMSQIGVHPASPWVAILIGACIMIATTAINFMAIRLNITKTFPSPQRKQQNI